MHKKFKVAITDTLKMIVEAGVKDQQEDDQEQILIRSRRLLNSITPDNILSGRLKNSQE